MIELWAPIKGYEGLYEVSNKGRIKSLAKNAGNSPRKKRIRKLKETRHGYLNVSLWKFGKSKHPLVHRLVAMAFLPNPCNYPEVNHLDGDRKNANVENLEWCTTSQNIKHAFKIGNKNNRGENHSQHILTEKDVILIRKSSRDNKELAKKYHCHPTTIHSARVGKSWKHINFFGSNIHG